MKSLNKTIDEIILQYSTRGMDKLNDDCIRNSCEVASKNFLNIKKGNIFLYTGFYVNGFAETDGPLGTYFLARALTILGFKPIVITDDYCKNYFKEFETLYLSHEDCNLENLENILSKYNPVCHISIERCGKNAKDTYTNAAGKDISQFTPPIDRLFELGSISKPTFAIGDGGNEIGMGNFKSYIKKNLNIEPSSVHTKFLIIASVSNWGAYGFIAYLEKYFEESLLPSFEEVNSYLEYIVSLGSVDGIKGVSAMSVDGKEWIIEKQILEELKDNLG